MAVTGARLQRTPLSIVRAAELNEVQPDQQWLIETLWTAGGVGLVGGSPKSLKTWIGLELAVSVASGTPCLEQFRVHQRGPSLIYLAEDRLCAVKERLRALCKHRGLDIETLDVLVITDSSLRLDQEVDVNRLDEALASHTPKLLLLDPFVRLHRANENDAQDVAGILASLRELQRRHEVAIVVVHHTRKNSRATQHGQALRGSGDFHAWSDSALYLNHTNSTLQLTIEHRAAPAPRTRYVRLALDPPHPVLVEPDTESEPSLEERVLATLRQTSTPMRRKELRRLLRVNNHRLGDTLLQLERLGRIRRTDRGWTR